MVHVRRSRLLYFFQAAWSLFCLSQPILLNQSSLPFVWVFIGLVSLAILIRYFFKPYYFEVDESRLMINRELYYTETIPLADIEKMEIQKGLFSKSYIHLKRGRKVEFNYFRVNDADFMRFKDRLPFPVE